MSFFTPADETTHKFYTVRRFRPPDTEWTLTFCNRRECRGLELAIAFDLSNLSHYFGDGALPLSKLRALRPRRYMDVTLPCGGGSVTSKSPNVGRLVTLSTPFLTEVRSDRDLTIQAAESRARATRVKVLPEFSEKALAPRVLGAILNVLVFVPNSRNVFAEPSTPGLIALCRRYVYFEDYREGSLSSYYNTIEESYGYEKIARDLLDMYEGTLFDALTVELSATMQSCNYNEPAGAGGSKRGRQGPVIGFLSFGRCNRE